jgi:predicted adenylyl cyclase CyaB
MSKNPTIIETRAWVDRIPDIKQRVTDLGAAYIDSVKIEDDFYADLTELNVDKHTFEESGKACRIRTLTSTSNKRSTVTAQIREAPQETPSGLKFHDATIVSYERTETPDKKEDLIEEMRVRGFTSFITKIVKNRDILSLNGTDIYIDDIEEFSKAIEIKTILKEGEDAAGVKASHKELISKLGIDVQDIIEKSHTHLIIDAYFRSQPKLREDFLNKKLRELIKEKDTLMLESAECYREGGDGWHDNARWDILRENIDVLSIRISKLKEEIFALKSKDTRK